MKILKVIYTTKPDYTEQNKININNVMTDLQNLHHTGINYNVCLSSDEKTFIHTAFFQSDNDQKILNELPSFKYFQEQLKAGGFETPPKQDILTLIGSSNLIFNS